MNIVCYSVVLNQHQAPVADELWALTNHNFTFVELINGGDTKGGTENYSKRPYLLKAWKSNENYQNAMNLCVSADCCIFSGIESLPFETERMKYNKLSFEMGERWFKKGALSLLSPRLWKWLFAYNKGNWRRKKLFKLCCSAYCARDHYKLLTFKGKCYRWGYFTEVPSEYQHISHTDFDSRVLRIMWCARFIDWKHPETLIRLAEKLKNYFESANNRLLSNYYSSFHIDMYGDGELLNETKKLSRELSTTDYVSFHGNVPNNIVREALRNHDLFVFTSDRSEGWGAVTNEAMSEGCVLIGSNEIGSVPFLVENGENGFIFRGKNVDSLFDVVVTVMSRGKELEKISYKGYLTMKDNWSPQVAAQSLLFLIDGLENENYDPITSGPCSRI